MENLFYIIVTVVALIILIILLVVIGYIMTKGAKPGIFPPLANTCPDFWRTDPSKNGLCIVPEYAGANIGTFRTSNASSVSNLFGFSKVGNVSKIDFTNQGWRASSGTSAICAQQNFVASNGISWDGVGNYNGKC